MEREETKELFSKDEQAGLMAGEDYIIYNDLHGNVIIWINSDEEMQISVDTQDFIKIAANLFPNLDLSELLNFINRGDYIWTDKYQIKPLRSKFDFEGYQIIPTLEDALRFKRSTEKKVTPFGISF